MVREPDASHSPAGGAGHPSPPCRGPAGPAHAEVLLGWLEANGCTRLEVSAAGDGVRCVCPPGFWLGGGKAVRLWVV